MTDGTLLIAYFHAALVCLASWADDTLAASKTALNAVMKVSFIVSSVS
jgi:hypothetical protein